jgi:PhnB protein
MSSINPYLIYNGNAETAFNFYKAAFGGEFAMLMRCSDAPTDPTHPMPESARDKILHIALPIGRDNMLMASDTNPRNDPLQSGNNFHISINADSEEEARRLFAALSVHGTIGMPLEQAFWGALFGMFTDQFGIRWMINYDYTKST